MPFSEVPGCVSGFLKLPGQGGSFWVQPLCHPSLFVAATIVEKGGDSPSVRVLSGGEGDPGRGADGRVDVKVGKPDSLRSEPVDVLGFDGAAEAGEVGVTHVIDEDDNNVRSLGGWSSTKRRGDA